VVPGRGNGGDDVSWVDVDLTVGLKIKKIHATDSAATNEH
jgi:hypothetical protein